jgi:hypothetical protein
MFSGPVRWVGATQIFARPLDGGRQALAYAMKVAQDRELAMILPLPTPVGAAEDAVAFVDLSGEPTFFATLDALFPAAMMFSGGMSRGAPQPAPQTLKVHRVGSFHASFVPGLADFDRLDPVFRLPSQVWDQLPQYTDFGFCVFALRPPEGEERGFLSRIFGGGGDREPHAVHPMAFTFPRRNPAELFLPTVHVHDGAVPATARFDHTLYLQGEPREPDWEVSSRPAPRLGGQAGALLDGGRPVRRQIVVGEFPNQDTVVPL